MTGLLASLLAGCRDDHPVDPCDGDPCCSPGWASVLADGDAIVVAADGAVGPTGATRPRVVASLDEAIDLAAAGGHRRIGVARGTWSANLVLDDALEGLSIHGQCREEAVLDGSGRRRRPTVQVVGSDDARYALSDLTITGGLGGIEVLGGTLHGARLDVAGNRRLGVEARGPEDDAGACLAEGAPRAGGVELVDSTITGTRAEDEFEASGVGAQASCGLALRLERVRVEDNQVVGVVVGEPVAWEAPTAELVEVEVRDTVPHASAAQVPGGVIVAYGGWARWDGGVVEDVPYGGVAVFDPGTRLEATALAIRGADATGLNVVNGEATCDDCVIERNGGVGVQVCQALPCGAVFRATGGAISGNGVDGAVRSALPGGLSVFDDGVAELREVTLADNVGLGIAAAGSVQVTLEQVEVRGTRPAPDLAPVEAGGKGLAATDGARVDGTDVVFDGNTLIAVTTHDAPTSVVLRGGAIRDTVPVTVAPEEVGLPAGPATRAGWGVAAQAGSVVTLEGVALSGLSGAAVIAPDLVAAGTQVTLEDCAITGVAAGDDGVGDGLHLTAAAAVVRRTTIRDTVGAGIAASAGAEVEVEDTTVADVAASGPDAGAACLFAGTGARVTVHGATLERCAVFGIAANDAGTTVDVFDSSVADLVPVPATGGAVGLSAALGARLSATRTTVARSSYGGAWATGPGSTIELVDAVVEATAVDAPTVRGLAVAGADGATVIVRGGRLAANRGTALQLDQGAVAEVDDLEIAGTVAAQDDDLGSAVAVLVGNGSTLTAERLTVVDSDGDALASALGGTVDCVACTLTGNAGIGAVALGATLSLREVEVCGNTVAGVLASAVDAPAAVALEDSVVCAHPVAGVYLVGPGTYVLRGNTLAAALPAPGPVGAWGNAVFAAGAPDSFDLGTGAPGPGPWTGDAGLWLDANTFVAGHDATVVLIGSSATLSDNAWSGADVELQQLSCAATVPPVVTGAAPSTDLCGGYDRPYELLQPTFVPAPLVILE